MTISYPSGVQLRGRITPAHERILTREAVAFVADLARTFGGTVRDLMARRAARQEEIDARARAGEPILDFLPQTRHIREGQWTCAPLPKDLRDRRVEITGPVERKMVINALNSGASVFMADFEDATSPTWDNQVLGQGNLFDAIRRTITFEQHGKSYALKEQTATLLVRPRGFHLSEAHMLVDGIAVPGALFDFGLYFFHNARELVTRDSGPYFYLPKMESHLEARLWNVVFLHAQRALGIAAGTIKATVLIETLPAAFEMHEILYELREHAAGLNCGRWDYIFSFIKKHAYASAAILPDRAQITMDKGFLRAYSQLLIQTCHRRGVHAMGGMAAQIPIKEDAARNEAALAKVRADKIREAKDGHDGTWVAHPALVAIARDVFDEQMPGPNQIGNKREDVSVRAVDLLAVPEGTRTIEGLRHNVRVGVQYVESWLRGQGCVPLYSLMEDAATAEISRAQVWQWLTHGAAIDGEPVSRARYTTIVDEEMRRIRVEVGEERFTKGRFAEARELFDQMTTQKTFEDFLTLPAYARITTF
ncbi:malate synthase A [soil metagenome]